MNPRSVQVRLKAGVGHANLPDGRRMATGVTYTITWEDFQLITLGSRQDVIDVVSFTNTPLARRGVLLTANSVTVPTGMKLGQVEAGIQERDAFKLVKVVDATAAAVGDVLCWADIEATTVTKDRVGGSAATPLRFAGVALGTISQNRYGWIQTEGLVTDMKLATGLAAGDLVAIHPTTDGTATAAGRNERVRIAVDATGGTFTVTFGAQTTPAQAFNVTAATLQAALIALSSIEAGEVSVTGGPGNAGATTPYVIEFVGGKAETDVGAVTTSAVSLTGGAATAAVTVLAQGFANNDSVIGTAVEAEAGGVGDVVLRGSDGLGRGKLSNVRSRAPRGRFPVSR